METRGYWEYGIKPYIQKIIVGLEYENGPIVSKSLSVLCIKGECGLCK